MDDHSSRPGDRECYAAKETAFADNNTPFNRHESIVAANLWQWVSASGTERSKLIANASDFCAALEWYLCEALSYDPLKRGWWCDGVCELSVTLLSDNSFRVFGAAFWQKSGHTASAFYLAPFELELYYHAIGDSKAKRTIFRFGRLESGEIKREQYDSIPSRIIDMRPHENSAWAIAIELT